LISKEKSYFIFCHRGTLRDFSYLHQNLQCVAFFFTEPFLMSVAAGPFTTSDSLLYEPLADLMQKVQIDKPDLLILVSLMKNQMVNFVNLYQNKPLPPLLGNQFSKLQNFSKSNLYIWNLW